MHQRHWIRMLLTLWPLAFLAEPGTATAQPSPALTIEESHRMAMKNYQVIGASGEHIEQARQIRREAGSLLLPTLITQIAATHNAVSAEFEFDGQRIKILPAYDYNLAFLVSQPVFSGMRNIKAKRQAEMGVDIAAKSYEVTAQDSLLQVTRTYYLALAIQENIDITQRSVEVNTETLRTAQSLFRAGESVVTAVLRAEVALTDSKRELLEARNNFVIAKENLALLTGFQGDFQIVRPAKPQRPDASLEELVQTGFGNRSELQAIGIQSEIADLQVQRQRGQYLPDIRLEGTVVRRRAEFPSNTLGSVSINANWTLFDGFRRSAQVAEARSQLREVELRRALLQRQVELQVRTAYLDIETQTASVDMLEEQVEFARINAESTQRAFRVGEATDLDILASNETLIRSERQLALATYQLELAIYELERATGTFARETISDFSGGEK